MEPKRGMSLNACQTDAINVFNAIAPLVIVGVCMRILAKTYLALQLRMVDRIVQ